MKLRNKLPLFVLIIWVVTFNRLHAQSDDLENLFHDLESMDAGTQAHFDRADPVFNRLVHSSRENVVAAIPVILHATSNPHLSVRRMAAAGLYAITTRLDGQALLSAETDTFTTLLVDPDLPIRRITGMAIDNLRLNASSPLVPVLETYLAREDAVSTIGPGVAGLLLKAAPTNTDSIGAVVQFMRREDNTSKSRHDILQSIQVARSGDPRIGKEVAVYADDPDEQLSVHAIQTLQHMGTSIVMDNRQSLARIASDPHRTQGVRSAATTALSQVKN